MAKPSLTLDDLLREAKQFAISESSHDEPSIFGTTDGKAIGTYFEHKFQNYLLDAFDYEVGSSAKGKDFPNLNVDIKVTSQKQPQSSCPFKSAGQKIYGLGYSLLVFVYQKSDDEANRTGRLEILHTIFIEASRTADFQTTTGILKIIGNEGNEDDIIAFLEERRLPVDEIQARELAAEILRNPPQKGYLTISNALQWRLQYGRAISTAGNVDGVLRIN